jgi:hypothetical protein
MVVSSPQIPWTTFYGDSYFAGFWCSGRKLHHRAQGYDRTSFDEERSLFYASIINYCPSSFIKGFPVGIIKSLSGGEKYVSR